MPPRQDVTLRSQPGKASDKRGGLAKLFTWLLLGDLVFVLIDQIEPRVMPVLLKQHGATDFEIALIVSSIPSLLMLVINPVVSYRSDRIRSRWGRRIPFLAIATPFVSALLMLTPFAPELAGLFSKSRAVAEFSGKIASSPTVLMFGIVVFAYQIFKSAIPAVFFSLLRDVVPLSHLGRFMSLFRIFGAVGTFILTYWLLSIIDTHAKAIFIGVAVLNLLGFGAVCLFVKEGQYPPVVDKLEARAGRKGLAHAVRNYCAECFSAPIYWWMYGARLFVYAAQLLVGFLIFFPQHDLGLPLEVAARITSWPSLAWLLFAYPVGMLLDRWGVFRVFALSLWLNIGAYIATFLLVTGERSFFVFGMATGMLFWMVMLAQIVFLQALVHPERVGQISSANAVIQSLMIGAVISPLVGWLLNVLKGYHAVLQLPLVGAVEIGPYRFVNLVMAALFAASLLCLYRAKAHYRRLGGPQAYQAPL